MNDSDPWARTKYPRERLLVRPLQRRCKAPLAADIAAAEPDPFLVLRSIRLSPGRAAELLATLRAIAEQTEDDDAADQNRYGLLLGLYQPVHAPSSTDAEA